jgi:hypothetical protein
MMVGPNGFELEAIWRRERGARAERESPAEILSERSQPKDLTCAEI